MKLKPALAVVAVCALTVCVALWIWGTRLEFLIGGALINAGSRLQDDLERYDFEHEEVTPDQIWQQFVGQNRMASAVLAAFPRSTHHPVLALVTCMDARLDTNEIAGDTRHYYYVLRLAGSALAPKDEEMLDLAVLNGVKVVVFTTHSDCAADKVAQDPNQRREFPELSRAVDERTMRFQEFQARPRIRERMAHRELIVKWMDLDTATERVTPHAGNRLHPQ